MAPFHESPRVRSPIFMLTMLLTTVAAALSTAASEPPPAAPTPAAPTPATATPATATPATAANLAGPTTAGEATAAEKAVEARIARLIRDLGADQFIVRERAQAELEGIGVAAFDALDEVRDSEDVELSMRVRYLLRVQSAAWIQEDDPPEIRGVLKRYGELAESDRRSQMERLAAYGHSRALAALCRLARFEPSPVLSKRAALLVMSTPLPASAEARATIQTTIDRAMGNSRRLAAAWLRQFGETLVASEPQIDSMVANWRKTLAAESRELASGTLRGGYPATNAAIVRDLHRWQFDFLIAVKRDADASAVATELLAAVAGSPGELADLVSWLAERRLWTQIEALSKRFENEFSRSAPLAYRRAEARSRQGDQESAERIASEAFELSPDLAKHLEMGLELRDRGLIAWAEREFRQVLAQSKMGETEDLTARHRLAEMFYDHDRPLDAAKVWRELCDKLDTDMELQERMSERRQFFRSRMHFFYAKQHLAAGEIAQAREQLEQGIRHDPHDADVLIAMHRLPNSDDAWRQRTKTLVAECSSHFLTLVQRWELILPQVEASEEVLENVANSCNQYAWLVGNTGGDVAMAVKMSLRSVELMPKSASYLDTLAHCYFAQGDFENAVRHQTEAVKREPHTKQLQRQLDVFRKALEEQRKERRP
jgi:tetratricopeptide (TPR) repeat protein